MKRIAMTVILWVCLLLISEINAKSFAIQKKKESLMSKLDAVHQRNVDIRNYRGIRVRDAAANQILARECDDVFEAIVMRTLIIRMFHIVEKSLKVSSHGLRVLGDTAAGLLSSTMRGLGGLLNVISTLMAKISNRVDYSIPKDSMGKSLVVGDTRINLVTTLNNIAALISGVSHACIWGGEITESLTLGLGEAVQDSFRGLELIARAGNRAINFIFLNDFVHDEPEAYHMHPNKSARSVSQTINHMPNLVISYRDNEDDLEDTDYDVELKATTKRLSDEVQAELAHLKKLEFQSSGSSSQPSPKQHSQPSPTSPAKDFSSISSFIRTGNSDFAARQGNYNEHSETEQNHDTTEMGISIDQILKVGRDQYSYYSSTFWNQFSIAKEKIFTNLHLYSSNIVFGNTMTDDDPNIDIYHGIGFMSIYLLLLFMMVFIASVMPVNSWNQRLSIMCFVLFGVWALILWMEYHQRSRLIQRVSSQSVKSYLAQQVQGFGYHPTDLVEDDKYMAEGHMQVAKITNQVWRTFSDQEKQHAENIAWANILLSSLWTLYDHELEIGGLGSYTNDIYEDMLTAELSNIPPGFANLRLKRFDLGTNPPFIKGIKGFTYRNHTCIRELETALNPSGNDSEFHSRPKQGFAAILAEWEDRFSRSSSRGGTRNRRANHADLEEKYTTAMEQLLTLFAPSSRSRVRHKDHAEPDKSSSSKGASNDNKDTQNSDSFDSEIKDIGAGYFDHFSVDCDRLYLDLDVVYTSKDMDIVLSLRPSDLRSMVPEMAVTLSEVRLVGEIRIGIQLTHDYPFFGNASVSILVTPLVVKTGKSCI